MILSGKEILKQIGKGSIEIDPFDPKYVNPASVDLTLGTKVSVYHGTVGFKGRTIFQGKDMIGADITPRSFPSDLVLDSKQKLEVHEFEIDPEKGWILRPGVGYLMHTAERIHTDEFVPILDGKSSIGRLFIKIHETAGFGDPGFNGQFTLEVTCQFPVIVYAGMRFCQIRFHTLMGETVSYQDHKSNYVGDKAVGPVPSRSWKMFL